MSSDSAVPEKPVSPDRLWAEQLAIGLFLLLVLLIFMALFHPQLLSLGTQVLTTNDLPAFGWAAVIGVVLQLFVHEGGTLAAAKILGLPLRLRFFPFGAHAAAILSHQPRRPWVDATVGMAGPLTGAVASGICAAIHHFSVTDENPAGNTFLLAMACVGYFYNLFTLIPLLDLEGGWIAPALPPAAWLFGLVLVVIELVQDFNLLLLGVLCFGLPRFVMILIARAPRTDLRCAPRQRAYIALAYFILILALGWFGSTTFEALTHLIPEAMGD